MKFAKDKVYKIVEMPGAIVITEPNTTVKEKGAVPVMQGLAQPVLLFLDAYMHYRSEGKSVREAHTLAMARPGVTGIILPPGFGG